MEQFVIGTDFVKEIATAKDKIELLFNNLAALTDDLGIKTREFEERLSEFSELPRTRD